MKTRSGYVSNSSSSSFIIDFDSTYNGISCVKLSSEIVRMLRENATDADDKKMELTDNKTWYLTQFVNDCDDDHYDKVANNGIRYMDGGFTAPYGEEENYIIIYNSCKDEFFIDKNDLVNSIDGAPTAIELSKQIKDILKSKINAKTKLQCIENLVNKFQAN